MTDGANPRTAGGPLAGIRVLEASILSPDALGMHLADLGAEVIKIEEPPLGDYVREVGSAMVDGISLLHRRWNRGKRSLALNLRDPRGVAVFEDLVRESDVVVEGLRPGALERRGLGYGRLHTLQPKLVFASLSGFGQSGPYRDLATHGVGFDSYGGLAPPTSGPEGLPSIPPHTTVGIQAGPLFGALAVTAALVAATRTGQGCFLDVAQADAAAWWSSGAVESSLIEGQSPSVDLSESVRYQYYATADHRHILFMATEDKFWRRFCMAARRQDLYQRFPPKRHSDHERGNLPLRRELAALFATRSQSQWVEFFLEADVPGVPANAPGDLTSDPQFRARARWLDGALHGTALLGTPVQMVDGSLPSPGPAPMLGEHSEAVLRDILGYDADRISSLKAAGVIQTTPPTHDPG